MANLTTTTDLRTLTDAELDAVSGGDGIGINRLVMVSELKRSNANEDAEKTTTSTTGTTTTTTTSTSSTSMKLPQ